MIAEFFNVIQNWLAAATALVIISVFMFAAGAAMLAPFLGIPMLLLTLIKEITERKRKEAKK